MTTLFNDYYAVLEVTPEADQAAIRASYMRLALQRHPDRNLDNRDATNLFQLLQQAYTVLGNPTTRRIYDRERQRQVLLASRARTHPRASANPSPFDSARATPRTSHTNPAFPFHETPEEAERHRQRLRAEMARRRQEESARRARAGPSRERTPREEMARTRLLEREARLRESGHRIREAAVRVRESAFRFRQERERRAREEALWNAQRVAFVEAELKVMELD